MRSYLSVRLRCAAMFTGLLFAAACASESVSAPLLTPDQADLAKGTAPTSGETGVKVGGRLNPLKSDIIASEMIGPAGGVLRVPELGFELVVPPGAVAATVKFRVTALAGNSMAYEFEPHALKFAVPLIFRQDNRFGSVGYGQQVGGGYFSDKSKVDVKGKKAKVAEVMPGRWSGSWIEFDISHFSGYLVSCA